MCGKEWIETEHYTKKGSNCICDARSLYDFINLTKLAGFRTFRSNDKRYVNVKVAREQYVFANWLSPAGFRSFIHQVIGFLSAHNVHSLAMNCLTWRMQQFRIACYSFFSIYRWPKSTFTNQTKFYLPNAFACGIHFTFALNFVIVSHTHSTSLFFRNVCILLFNRCKASVWALKYVEVYFILWEWKNGKIY